jgi:protoporphyrinogen oxidase
VPRPSFREVVSGALGIENRGMGYNSTFRYPKRGGIGILPDALARRVEHMRSGTRAVAVDLGRQRVTLAGGERVEYDRLVVTIPLPAFLRMLDPDPGGLGRAAERLDWSVVGCLNLGVDRPGVGDGAHWTYFPERDLPFYRVGHPTNFSSAVAPAGTSSMYVEFGLGRGERLDRASLERAAVAGLEREAVLRPGDRILVRDWVVIDPGYVIFDRRRQQVMAEVVPELERQRVHLIGRYGAWTYSYMERALLDGLELADKLRA